MKTKLNAPEAGYVVFKLSIDVIVELVGERGRMHHGHRLRAIEGIGQFLTDKRKIRHRMGIILRQRVCRETNELHITGSE